MRDQRWGGGGAVHNDESHKRLTSRGNKSFNILYKTGEDNAEKLGGRDKVELKIYCSALKKGPKKKGEGTSAERQNPKKKGKEGTSKKKENG